MTLHTNSPGHAMSPATVTNSSLSTFRDRGQPRRARPSSLHPEMSAARAFASQLTDSVKMVERNALVMMLSDVPEGPHQYRVGLRRLRAAVKAFRSLLDRVAAEELNAWARDLGRAAADWRDADVALGDIFDPAEKAGALPVGAAALKRALETERRRARATARAAMRELDPTGFVEKIEAELDSSATPFGTVWDESTRKNGKAISKQRASAQRLLQPVQKQARRSLDKAWGKVLGHGARLETLSIEERHEMRKALKGLRYTVDMFAPLFVDENSAAFASKLRRLQNVFGYLNDVAMAETMRARLQDFKSSPAAAAADATLEWHQDRAESAWRKALRRWRDLEATPRFW